jgi:hypothetical protein
MTTIRTPHPQEKCSNFLLQLEAADGIRTHDLLHGNKFGLGVPFARKSPICSTFQIGGKSALSRRYEAICADMHSFGHFPLEVPGSPRAVRIEITNTPR